MTPTRTLSFFNSTLTVPESSFLSVTVTFGKRYSDMVTVFVQLQADGFDSTKEAVVTQSTLDAVAKQLPDIATKDMKSFFRKLSSKTETQIEQELLCLRVARALMKCLNVKQTIVQLDVFDALTGALRPYDDI